MMPAELKRFPVLDALPASVLDGVIRQARRLEFPGGRWLVRPGRTLSAGFFLLEGRVRLLEGGRSLVVAADSARARRAVYPGSAGIETLTRCVFLRLDLALLRLVEQAGEDADAATGIPAVPEVHAGGTSWQERFLASPLMQGLDMRAWQQVLTAMSCCKLPAGAHVLTAGAPAEACYVLSAGRAEIRAAGSGEVLTVLEPGSLFGEDALVSGGRRSATAVMVDDGSVVGLSAPDFQTLLLDRVVRPLAAAGGRPLLALEPHWPKAALTLQIGELRGAGRRLAGDAHYAIVGAAWPERSLAAFLLAEQGVDARPVVD